MKSVFTLVVMSAALWASTAYGQLKFEEGYEVDQSWSSAQDLFNEIYDTHELDDGTFLCFSGGRLSYANGTNERYSMITRMDKYGQVIEDQYGQAEAKYEPFSIPSIQLVSYGTYMGGWITTDYTRRSLGFDENEQTYVVYGLNDIQELILRKYDLQGNLIFSRKIEKEYLGGNTWYFYQSIGDILIDENGDILVFGVSNYDNGNGIMLPSITRFTSNGEFIQRKEYEFADYKYERIVPQFIQGASGNDYFISFVSLDNDYGHESFLFRLHNDLSVDWQISDKYTFQYPIVEEEEDKYVTGGFQLNFSTNVSSRVIRFSPDYFGGAYTFHKIRIDNFILKSIIPAPFKYTLIGDQKVNGSFRSICARVNANLNLITSARIFSESYAFTASGEKTNDGGTMIHANSEMSNLTLYHSLGSTVFGVPNKPYLIKLDVYDESNCDESIELITKEYNPNPQLEENDPVHDGNTEVLSYEEGFEYMDLITEQFCCTESIEIQGTAQLCPNGTTSLSVSYAAQSGDNIFWTHNGMPIFGSAGQTSIFVNAVGEYHFFVAKENGCLVQGHITVSNYPPPLFASPLSFSQAHCNYDAPFALYFINEPLPGTWSGPGVTGTYPNYTFDPALAGVGLHHIQVEYIDANGCEWNLDAYIEVIGITDPVVAPSIPNSKCIYSSPYNLPGSGVWTNLTTGQPISTIYPSQYCSGCYLILQYCEQVVSGSTVCDYCDPNTYAVTFHSNCSADKNDQGSGGSKDAGMAVFPNPASDVVHVTLEVEGTYQFRLLDMTGCTVLEQSLKGNSSTIDISTLANGVYTLSITNGQYELTKRLTVQ